MEELKPPKFKKGDVIIKNFYSCDSMIMGTITKSDKMGSYVGSYDIPGETTYTVDYVQKQTYSGEADVQYHHYCYKLKEADCMFIHDSRIVDIEFDLYSDWVRGIKLKKILDEIQNR